MIYEIFHFFCLFSYSFHFIIPYTLHSTVITLFYWRGTNNNNNREKQNMWIIKMFIEIIMMKRWGRRRWKGKGERKECLESSSSSGRGINCKDRRYIRDEKVKGCKNSHHMLVLGKKNRRQKKMTIVVGKKQDSIILKGFRFMVCWLHIYNKRYYFSMLKSIHYNLV